MFHRYLDVLVGRKRERLPLLVEKLKKCRNDAQALQQVMLPLAKEYSIEIRNRGLNDTTVRNLIQMHSETDHKYIYREFKRFNYLDNNPPSARAPENIFRTIVVAPERAAYTGPPIIWEKVRRLRNCYFEAISEKVPGKGSVNPLDVIVDIPWGKGANRMLKVVDADRTYLPQDITLTSHLAPTIFQEPTAFSAPIRVFLSKELYYLVLDERDSINASVLEMYFSRDAFDDPDPTQG